MSVPYSQWGFSSQALAANIFGLYPSHFLHITGKSTRLSLLFYARAIVSIASRLFVAIPNRIRQINTYMYRLLTILLYVHIIKNHQHLIAWFKQNTQLSFYCCGDFVPGDWSRFFSSFLVLLIFVKNFSSTLYQRVLLSVPLFSLVFFTFLSTSTLSIDAFSFFFQFHEIT